MLKNCKAAARKKNKSLTKTHIRTYITDREQQSCSTLPFVSCASLTETRDIMMSALQRLPQQREICLSSPVMDESVFVCAIPHYTLPLKPLPALFIDPKATCVYLVYYYAPNSSRRMLSDSSKSRFNILGPCSASCSSPLTF